MPRLSLQGSVRGFLSAYSQAQYTSSTCGTTHKCSAQEPQQRRTQVCARVLRLRPRARSASSRPISSTARGVCFPQWPGIARLPEGPRTERDELRLRGPASTCTRSCAGVVCPLVPKSSALGTHRGGAAARAPSASTSSDTRGPDALDPVVYSCASSTASSADLNDFQPAKLTTRSVALNTTPFAFIDTRVASSRQSGARTCR